MTSNRSPSKLPKQPSILEAQGFDYAALDTETRIVVQQHASEIKSLMRRTATDIINIGQLLIEVKQQLGHGNFRNWLKSEFNWSVSAATKFVQVAVHFKCVNFTHLNITASALYLLAAPSTPEQARSQALERATQGEAITHTEAKSIVNQHKNSDKPKDALPVTVDVPAETVDKEPSIPAIVLDAPATVVEIEPESNDPDSFDEASAELLGKKVEPDTPSQFQVGDYSQTKEAAGGDELPSQQQTEVEVESLFESGSVLLLTDNKQRSLKWIGEIGEVVGLSDTDIQVIVKISLHPVKD